MRGNSKASLAVAVVFMLGISLPMLGQLFPALDSSATIEEKRDLAAMPSLRLGSIASFPEQFEDYFNDHFGFRNAMVRFNNYVRLKAFNASSSPKVLTGKDGWLFYTGNYGEDGAPVANHLGLLPEREGLFQAWKAELEFKRNLLAGVGVRYVFVVAPDKWTVYPEYLPDGYAAGGRGNMVDQLLEYLRKNSDVEIVDLRQALIDAKEEGRPLYYKHGTHWNNLGAYYAYRELSGALSRQFPAIRPRALDDFEIAETRGRAGGDLATMLSLRDFLDDRSFSLTPKVPYAYVNRTEGAVRRDSRFYTRDGSELPRALMFRDSFTIALIPYLSDHFSAIAYISSYWHGGTDVWRLLGEVKPDIVIEERVERYMAL